METSSVLSDRGACRILALNCLGFSTQISCVASAGDDLTNKSTNSTTLLDLEAFGCRSLEDVVDPAHLGFALGDGN